MKIKQVLTQHHNTFTAEVECEFCKFVEVRCGAGLEDYEKQVLFVAQCLRCYRSTEKPRGVCNPHNLDDRGYL